MIDAAEDCDDRGRMPGMIVCTLDEALEFLRGMRKEEW